MLVPKLQRLKVQRVSVLSSMRGLLVGFQWGVFAVSLYLGALLIAWRLLASVDFLYPLWYDVLGIEQTIKLYGPQNHFRRGFEETSRWERERLFSAIVTAIHDQGGGLENLFYRDSVGHPIGQLLTSPEILHLQDVSRLVDLFLRVGLGGLILGTILMISLHLQSLSMPPVRILLLGTFAAMSGAMAFILLIGPEDVFYGLHTWLFPPEHPWFFYYQDSLMTTLMKAPDLFGCIALALLVLSLLLLIAALYLCSWLYQRLGG